MDRQIISLFGAATAAILVASSAHASRGHGVLTGVVRDSGSGEAIADAVVVVRRDRTQVHETVATERDGYWRVPNIVPGDYELQVTGIGYQSKVRGGIRVQAGAAIRVDMSLQAAGEGRSRTVVVPAPTVDVTASSVGIHVDREMARRVPIVAPGGKGGANRSFEAIAEMMPGADPDAYGTSIAGTTSPENLYLIDGLPVGNAGYGVIGMPLSVEFLDQVHVESGGYQAEAGRSTGAIVHAVTKTGANKFFGSVWINGAPGILEGRRELPRREATAIVLQQDLRWQGDSGFDLGGYLVKDRLWFYTGMQVARTVYNMRTAWYRTQVDPGRGEVIVDDETGVGRTERIADTTTSQRAQGTTLQVPVKLTLRAARNHELELFGLYGSSVAGGNGTYGINQWTGQPEIADGLGTFESRAHRYDNRTGDLQARWTAASDDRKWHADTTLGWHHQVDKSLAADGGALGATGGLGDLPNVQWRRNQNPGYHSATEFLPLPDGADAGACDPVGATPTCPVITFTTGGPRRGENYFERVHARNVVTRHARGLGHHVIKFGVDLEYAQYRDVRALSGGRNYRESLDGSKFRTEELGLLLGPDRPLIFDKLDRTTSSTTAGGFVQDSWSIRDRVTLNVGVRYDAQRLFNADRELALALANQLAPRVGLVWDPSQAGRAKLFVSYGRAYQNIPLNFANRAGSGNPVLYSNLAASDCDPADLQSHHTACQGDGARLVNGSASTTDQLWTPTSSERSPVDPAIKPQSRDEIVVGGEWEVLADARLGARYAHSWLDRVIEDMSRDEGYTYFVGNPGRGLAADFPRARRVQDSATVFFSKLFARGWGLEASYSLAWLRGNIAGLFRPDTGQLQPNLNSDFDLMSLMRNNSGPLPADHRHNIKLFGAGEVPVGKRGAILLGTAFRALSGGPSSVLAAHEFYGPNTSFLVPRGAGPRLPWQFRIDSSFGYSHRVGERVTLSGTISVYNVAGFQGVVAVDQAYTLDNARPTYARSVTELDRMMIKNSVGDPIVKNPNFGRPTRYQAPRQFQFGLRLDF